MKILQADCSKSDYGSGIKSVNKINSEFKTLKPTAKYHISSAKSSEQRNRI